jgi:hypothetical protein
MMQWLTVLPPQAQPMIALPAPPAAGTAGTSADALTAAISPAAGPVTSVSVMPSGAAGSNGVITASVSAATAGTGTDSSGASSALVLASLTVSTAPAVAPPAAVMDEKSTSAPDAMLLSAALGYAGPSTRPAQQAADLVFADHDVRPLDDLVVDALARARTSRGPADEAW